MGGNVKILMSDLCTSLNIWAKMSLSTEAMHHAIMGANKFKGIL